MLAERQYDMRWPSDLELIFFPGLDGTGLSYEPLKKELPDDTQVTLIKYPPDKPLLLPQLVDYAVDQIPKGKPLLILAESFSGPVAVSLLSSIQLNVRGIIFCSTFVKSPRPVLLSLAKYVPISWLFYFPVPDVIFYVFCGGKKLSESVISLFLKIKHIVKPNVIAQRVRMLGDIDVISKLAGLSIPCCYIQAIDDKIVPPRCVEQFQNVLVNLKIKKVKGPHFILQTKPKECAELIMAFIKFVTSRST